MRLTLQADGETVDAEITLGDMIRYEQKFGETVGELTLPPGAAIPPGHLEKTLFLAWVVAKRTKKTTLEFLDWCDTVELDSKVEVAESDPLAPQPNGSRNSSSPPASNLPSLPAIPVSS